MTPQQQERFAALVAGWYARAPFCASVRGLDKPLELTRNDEDELAFQDLPMLFRMYAIRVNPAEYEFLASVIHSFKGELDVELLEDLETLVDR